MQRYGIIVTEKVGREDAYIHWLKKGTIVEFLIDEKDQEYVQCVAPCFGVPVAQFKFRKHVQYVNPEDVIEIAPDQLEALRAIAD
jgi:hypothetical protein